MSDIPLTESIATVTTNTRFSNYDAANMLVKWTSSALALPLMAEGFCSTESVLSVVSTSKRRSGWKIVGLTTLCSNRMFLLHVHQNNAGRGIERDLRELMF